MSAIDNFNRDQSLLTSDQSLLQQQCHNINASVNKYSSCNLVPNINVYSKKLDPSNQSIPKEIFVQSLELRDIHIDKLDRYVFPKVDRGPTKAGLIEIPPLQSLKYVVNLFCHKLEPDLKLIWDELCGRDVQFPEISRAGIQATKYDIRNECSQYKKTEGKN